MGLFNQAVQQALVRRAVSSLLAVGLGLVAAAFLTTAAWIAIAENYSSLAAASVIGATYLLLAVLAFLIRPQPRLTVDEPDGLGIGLALSASFVEGFSAARRVRR
jgi:membrane protein YdbS with pleckstrin-like domain